MYPVGSYFSSGTRLSHLILWTGDLVLERVFALLVLLPVVSKCAFESVLRVLHQAACCTSWLTGVTKGCPQRGTTLRCSLTTMCITSQSLQSVPECSMVYHVYHSERLHAQSASICRRVRQGLPTYSVVVHIISSATYSVVAHIVSAASSKDICLELSITESGPRARISSDEKTVVMPVAKVPAGNTHCIKSDYNSQPSDYKSRHQGHLPSALLGLSMSLGTLS